MVSILFLPLHGEVTQWAHDEAWQVLTEWDKQSKPPVGHHNLATLEHSP